MRICVALLIVIGVVSPLANRCLSEEPVISSDAYQPTAEMLAMREAFQDDKFGVFIHWGVYSVLARGEWVMNKEKITVADYEPIAKQFNLTKFDADAWCKLFKQAGAKYITITSKHHDGFAMWDSDTSDWDIVDRTPYGKDVLKQLADACERNGLKLYLYHSHLDWHHPDYFPRGRTGRDAGRPESGDFNKYIDYMNAQLTELLSGEYGKISGIWFDGWWDQKQYNKDKPGSLPTDSQVDWRLRETYDLIHRLQPTCMVGSNHHVAPFAGEDFQMFEKDLPGSNAAGFSEGTVIGELPLETCETINGSWGYNAGDNRHKSPEELIRFLVRAAGTNANLLLNVGPKPDGTIDDVSAERLLSIGKWLEKFGPTIYGTRGGPIKPQEWGVATHKGDTVYLHVIAMPAKDGEGRIELAGTEGLKVESLKVFSSYALIDVARAANGNLTVKATDLSGDFIDMVLTGKFDK